MKKLYISIVAALLSGATLLVMAQGFSNLQRGPAPFEAYDQNGNGAITMEEFNAFRSERRAARAAEGRLMRNTSSAPSFANFDANGDGQLSRDELIAGQQVQMQMRGGNRGPGMRWGRGMGR